MHKHVGIHFRLKKNMKEKNIREQLYDKVLSIINSTNVDLITNSNQEKGVLIYTEIKPKIKELIDYLSNISIENLNELPESRFNILNSKLKPIFDEIGKIQTTEKNPNQTDSQQKQSTIQFFNYNPSQGGNGYFEKEKNEIWQIILEAITLENRKLQDVSVSAKKAKELDKIIKSVKGSENELSSVLNSAKIELSKGGVSKHSDIFGSQAGTHKVNAKNWRNNATGLLTLNAIMIISILILVIWVVDDRTLRIELGIFGAALVSLISYAVVLCVKNYFAEKHNQNVNQHRANCLGTFNTFIDSADEERKAAVLIQATNTIFSHQNTGYLNKGSDNSNPNPIVEIVRNVTKGNAD
jgi:hypothetical protein